MLAVALFSGAVYFILEYLEDYTLHGQAISVPDYQNQIWSDTLGISNSDFDLIIADSVYKKGAEKNLILDQDPAPMTTVKKGRKIYVTVSSANPPSISMPKLVDLSLRQAVSLLDIYGLQIGELTYRPDNCINCILEQKINDEEITAGRKLQKGSKVDLVVGQGYSDKKVSVPSLINLNLELANLYLKEYALNVGAITYREELETAEDSAKAKVFKQFPKYSEEPSVFMGSSVDLYLTIDTNNIDVRDNLSGDN